MTSPAPFLQSDRAARWLILADDLTGAADCAVAFARRGHGAAVSWEGAAGTASDTAVLAIDADSRRLSSARAAERHGVLVAAHLLPGASLLKKIDSTLRGQPAAELAATLAALRAADRLTLAVVAPAFPSNGRTTLNGRVRLDGARLEDSLLWARDHSYPTADLVAVLEGAGLSADCLGLERLRDGGAEAAVRAALRAGHDALVCDAVEATDLDAVAAATLPFADRVIWVGSGGLADALAAAVPAGDTAAAFLTPRPRVGRGVLLAVGSVAEVSRAAVAVLSESGAARVFEVPSSLLRRGGPAMDALSAEIAAVLCAGGDAAVTIEAEGSVDLSQGAALAEALALLLRPAGQAMGALFATGGETARTLLGALDVHGLHLVEEVEPGVPLGFSCSRISVPVVTKAGGFGTSATILRAHRRLRALLDGKDSQR